jgi:1,6-anhydro-N-acetylmuramate kinase
MENLHDLSRGTTISRPKRADLVIGLMMDESQSVIRQILMLWEDSPTWEHYREAVRPYLNELSEVLNGHISQQSIEDALHRDMRTQRQQMVVQMAEHVRQARQRRRYAGFEA